MVAHRAGVSDAIILYTLRRAGTNTIINLFNATNIYGQTFRTLFLEKYTPGSRFSLNIDVGWAISKVEEPIEQVFSPPTLVSLCDILWWRESESENISIKNKHINANDLYETCENDDTPLMVAYRTGVSGKTITDILELAAKYDIERLLDTRGADGKNLREMILEEYSPEYKSLSLNVEVHPLTVRSG